MADILGMVLHLQAMGHHQSSALNILQHFEEPVSMDPG